MLHGLLRRLQQVCSEMFCRAKCSAVRARIADTNLDQFENIVLEISKGERNDNIIYIYYYYYSL